MGKKQHQKDRLFLTSVEWRRDWGGFKGKKKSGVRPLPFNCCAVTFLEFENPVCDADGHQFDIENIVPFLHKHGTNPVTGKPLSTKDLIKLKYYKNDNGKYHCPLTFKEFTAHSHIVAIKTSGNVYSYEAIDKLNLKPKFWQDLMTGEKFTRKDVITIQDPHKLESHLIDNFAHVKARGGTALIDKGGINAKNATKRIVEMVKPKSSSISSKKPEKTDGDLFTGKRLPKNLLSKKRKERDNEEKSQKKAKMEAVRPRSKFSQNLMSASFTSTATVPVTSNTLAYLSESEIRERNYQRMKGSGKKGFVRIETNHGQLNLQLDCDLAPRTCHNFLLLCKRGYYDGIIFHRLIISFMIQGGDPTGTGRGGECAWGGKMKDEFHSKLKHDSRGVLSMANSGPDTNGSQFFVTFGPCEHLDKLHSVFGRLVGGMDVLNRLEVIKVDRKTKKPLEDVVIEKVSVFTDPFEEQESEYEETQRKKEEAAEKEKKEAERGAWFSNPARFAATSSKSSIGKYLQKSGKSTKSEKIKKSVSLGVSEDDDAPKKKKAKVTRFKDFSGW
eukprot:301673_1